MNRRRVDLRGAVLMMGLAAIALLAAGCGGSKAPSVAAMGTTTSSGSTVASAPAGTSSSSALAEAMKYTSCMRAHGVTAFPEPTPGGGFDVPLSLKSNPQWHSAVEACSSDLPGGGPSAKLHSADNIHKLLEFASCMRSHGITDFPDPNAQGQLDIPSNVDPDAPLFETAENACEARYPGTPLAVASGGS